MEKYELRTYGIRLADIFFKISIVLFIASFSILMAQIFIAFVKILAIIGWFCIMLLTLFLLLVDESFRNFPNSINMDVTPAMKVIPYTLAAGYVFLIISFLFYILFRKDYRCKNKIIISSVILVLTVILSVIFLISHLSNNGGA